MNRWTLWFALLLPCPAAGQWVYAGLGGNGVDAIAAGSSGLFVATADSGCLCRSPDGGAHWFQVFPHWVSSVAVAPGGGVYALRGYDSLYRSIDAGSSWLNLDVAGHLPPIPHAARLWNVRVGPSGRVFCGLEWTSMIMMHGTIFASSTDAGLSWRGFGLDTCGGGAFAFSGHRVINAGAEWLEGGRGPRLYMSSDDGTTWLLTGTLPSIPPYALALCQNGNILCGSPLASGPLSLSADSGRSWKQISTLVPEDLLALPSRVVLVGTKGGGVHLFSEHGDSAGPRNQGLGNLQVHTLTLDSSGYVYAGTSDGVWKRPLTDLVTGVRHSLSAASPGVVLRQNSPNPFNAGTEIVYQTPKITRVRLTVHDLLGREVATLVEEEKLPGTYAVRFLGTGLGSGVYVYRLNAGRHIESRKMVLLK